MAWIAVNEDKTEFIFNYEPSRYESYSSFWNRIRNRYSDIICIEVPKGTAFKLTGKHLRWKDDPIELT